jgi:hypothetical protein
MVHARTCVPKMAIFSARLVFPVTSTTRLHVLQDLKGTHVGMSPTFADYRRL